ncbi:hypothetical protein [Mycobacterium sp. 155]|uniref:hypothetical protein n=1 Tax=Mycobacterium sp. 155 TaxID=1157943 RepID=UPI0012FC7CAB|nr:hypothetical protein [Mycobacterium sp. 155]
MVAWDSNVVIYFLKYGRQIVDGEEIDGVGHIVQPGFEPPLQQPLYPVPLLGRVAATPGARRVYDATVEGCLDLTRIVTTR